MKARYLALILAPLGRDSQIALRLLNQAGYDGLITQGLSALCDELEKGAGLLLIASEALLNVDISPLLDLIEQQRRQPLPADLLGPFKPCASYDVVKKRHIHQGEPFCLIEMHVDSSVRALFPRGAEKRHKIAWLINQHVPGRLHEVQQTLSVAPADLPLSRALDCPFGTPVLQMTRRVLDRQGQVVLAGRFWYRGDRFVMDQSIPFDVWLHHPGMVIPDYHRAV